MKRFLEQARQDERICLVSGDLGFSVIEPFINEFPDRFLNAGVAEQSMIGIATGWSLAERKIVFVYSLANFPTLRCLEQIRNDCCAHDADVKIISLGGGVTYGKSGFSHFCIEDLAVMNAMPRMTIFAPGDAYEAQRCFDLAVRTPGPAYIRLAKSGEPRLMDSDYSFDPGDFIEYKPGNDICIIGIGTILSECLGAANLLESDISCAVIGLPVYKPLNKNKLADYLGKFSYVATVEEHTSYGGLGCTIGEIIASYGISSTFLKFSLPEGFDTIGSQADLLRSCGLTAEKIECRIREVALVK